MASRVEVVEWGWRRGNSDVVSGARSGRTAVIDHCGSSGSSPLSPNPLDRHARGRVRARREGRIPAAASVMADLRRVGFWLDDSFLREALRQFVGEDWEP
jgi:hypothetical protein